MNGADPQYVVYLDPENGKTIWVYWWYHIQKKDFWKLTVRVKDKWTVVKDGKDHLEMIIVDAKVIFYTI